MSVSHCRIKPEHYPMYRVSFIVGYTGSFVNVFLAVVCRVILCHVMTWCLYTLSSLTEMYDW